MNKFSFLKKLLFFAPKINVLLFFREFHCSNPSLSFKVVPFPEAIYFNPPPCHNFLFPPLYDFFGAHVCLWPTENSNLCSPWLDEQVTEQPSQLSIFFSFSGVCFSFDLSIASDGDSWGPIPSLASADRAPPGGLLPYQTPAGDKVLYFVTWCTCCPESGV